MDIVKKNFVKTLKEITDNIEAGNSEIDEEQAVAIMETVAHKPLSREGSARYLNMSTRRFGALVKAGLLPKGRKRSGFKEKVWYKDELKTANK